MAYSAAGDGKMMQIGNQSRTIREMPSKTEMLQDFTEAKAEQKNKLHRATIHIEARRRWFSLRLGELWEYRELVYFLVWRDLKVRYKQATFGIAWTIIQPLITMMIFTMIFGYFGKISAGGAPYPIFVLTALVPWSYFASALGRSGSSLLADANLIEKVYFPRLILALAAVTTPMVDFLCSFVVLLGMFVWYGVTPSWNILFLPLFLFLALVTALAGGLWLGPLNVRYRDIGHTLPFLIQVWMYLSPVIYPVHLVPERWRLLYSLNPMVGVIEGFRWALLRDRIPSFDIMILSSTVVFLLLWSGAIFFRRIEQTFVDVI